MIYKTSNLQQIIMLCYHNYDGSSLGYVNSLPKNCCNSNVLIFNLLNI